MPDSIISPQPSPRVVAAKQQLGIIGNAQALNEAVERALRVAPIDLSVLVTGESGTGKEFFPKIIHRNSPRKHNKYIAVNCGAIPEGTIDSELFGHEKGAFTGAVASRKGYFEEADGGTIFLDEVAELPLTTQARLLRVLENGEFIKVGSSEVQRTNVRIVAATNVDMQQAIAQGRFREDLYYRLSTVGITVPPLRDRGNDITILARKFAGDFAERYRMPQITFTTPARDMMLHQRWPGNVRQLKNVVEQIALFESGHDITPEILSDYLPEATTSFAPQRYTSQSASYEQEREMLFNLIFRLRTEIDSLRETISAIATGHNQTDRETRLPTMIHHSPIADTLFNPPHQTQTDTPAVVDITPTETISHDSSDATGDSMVTPDESFQAETLDQLERRTIIDALQRNGNRRKAAAAQLNISERTLYRKIKEYGLE